jgi:hypothetical protein
MKTITVTMAFVLFLVVGVVAACNGDDGSDETPTSSTTAATTTIVEPSETTSIEDDVVKASYLEYWEVYADAVYNLDPSRLDEVMTGPRLERARNEITNLAGQGRAVEIVVANNPAVVEVDGDEALVFDEYENQSHLIDPETKEPLSSPGQAETIRDTVTLTFIDGVWKVLDSVRQTE